MKDVFTKDVSTAAREARERQDPNHLLQAIPYAVLLGMRVGPEGLFHLPPLQSNVGNPTLPALHGGAVGGFLEMAAIAHTMMVMEVVRVPKVIGFSIDYIRPGRLQETYAQCEIERFGRKMVNVSMRAWQDDDSRHIAKARLQFLLD